jgi:uncharacterized protein (DUF2461 family)
MSDGFAEMIVNARSFLGQLAQNNDRDWVEARKEAFKSDIETPLKLIADLVAEDLSHLTGVAHSGKVGRRHILCSSQLTGLRRHRINAQAKGPCQKVARTKTREAWPRRRQRAAAGRTHRQDR